MATTPFTLQTAARDAKIDYPTGDGRPLAETPVHRDNLLSLIQVLKRWFADEPNVYVSGNMMMYYVEGDPRKHVSPDVFVTLGIAKDKDRDAYYIWEEGGRGPDLVIELTSKTTCKEDQVKKFAIYQDLIRVREYILFDPRDEYLKPRLKGYRLRQGVYVPMGEAAGRLPSEVLGLEFEADERWLRLYNPTAGTWLATPSEAEAAEREGRLKAEQELERLRLAYEELRSRVGASDNGGRRDDREGNRGRQE